MVKEKRILSYFICWLIVGIAIMFVGISRPLALNVNSEYVKMFDNYGTSLTEVTTTKVTSPTTYWTGTIPKVVSDSYGGAIIIQIDNAIASGINYSLSIMLSICSSDGSNCYNPALSSKDELGIANTVANAKTSYFNNTAVDVNYNEITNSYIYYNFTSKTNGSYILIPFTSSTTCSGGCIIEYYGYELVSNGVASELSSSDITNITNSQTNELNSSIQESTDTITGEIDDMEQTIVDSNKETQEVIKDQFNSCRDSYNLFDYEKASNISNTTAGGYRYFDMGNLKPNTKYTFYNYENFGMQEGIFIYLFDVNDNTYNWNSAQAITNQNKFYEKVVMTSSSEGKIYLGINPTNQGTWEEYIKYFEKAMLVEGTIEHEYEPYGEEICSNKIDDTNDKLDNIAGAITDESSPDVGALGDAAGWLPTGPADSILNIPLTLLNNISTNLSKSCSPLKVTLPFVDYTLEVPCISTFYEKIGATSLVNWVGVVASAFILYNYLMYLYSWVEGQLTLKTVNATKRWGIV